MAYCDVTDVQTLMGIDFSEWTGSPTRDEVSAIIDNKAAEMDGVLQAAGYTVPVTASSALELLESYNAMGAACAVWHQGWSSDTLPPRTAYWCQEYRDFLTRIRKGEQQLPGLDPTSDLDPVFAIVQMPPRDQYFTGEDEGLE